MNKERKIELTADELKEIITEQRADAVCSLLVVGFAIIAAGLAVGYVLELILK